VPVPPLPPPGQVALATAPAWPMGFAAAMGWVEVGPSLIRLDIAERVGGELGYATRRGPTALPSGLAGRLSVRAELLPVALRRLGFRIVPGAGLGQGEYGPPSPAMIVPQRRRRVAADTPVVVPAHGPFAALAALKR
jgi:ATP-dependent RNA helicase SUPV3L1/SUV3